MVNLIIQVGAWICSLSGRKLAIGCLLWQCLSAGTSTRNISAPHERASAYQLWQAWQRTPQVVCRLYLHEGRRTVSPPLVYRWPSTPPQPTQPLPHAQRTAETWKELIQEISIINMNYERFGKKKEFVSLNDHQTLGKNMPNSKSKSNTSFWMCSCKLIIAISWENTHYNE